MGNNVTFDEMNELLDEIYRSGGETWVEIDGQTYYTDWGYGAVAIEFFIRMLKNRKSDNDATLVRHSVAEDADEIIEHIINANMLSMPYDVYSELFDAVDGLGVEIENIQSENAKLREKVQRQADELTALRKAIEQRNSELRPWKRQAERFVAENAKLRELVQEALASHEKMCTQRGNCFGCQFFETKWSRACPIVTVNRSARELGIEVGK